MKKILIVLLISLQGCAVLSNPKVAAGCQVADGVTTYYALTHGAVETNGLFSAFGPGGILAFKLVLAYAIWNAFADRELSKGEQIAVGAATVMGCLPAVNNLQVIRELQARP